jgi:hypothetical protein
MTSVEPELKNRLLIQKATLTKPINAGTSINGPTTPTNASPEFRPKTATETAMANSKLFTAAVKERVADFRAAGAQAGPG